MDTDVRQCKCDDSFGTIHSSPPLSSPCDHVPRLDFFLLGQDDVDERVRRRLLQGGYK